MLPKSYRSVATLALKAGDNVEWPTGGNGHDLVGVFSEEERGRQGDSIPMNDWSTSGSVSRKSLAARMGSTLVSINRSAPWRV